MAESRANGNRNDGGDKRDGGQQVNPAEIARRELVEWCKAHKLPVPAERRPRR